jgi:hypothetical protein
MKVFGKNTSTEDNIDEMSFIKESLTNVIQCVVFSRINNMKLHSK